jgi:hypothetical protein
MNKSLKNSQNQDKKLWFKAKYYGWGWYPCCWRGGLVLLLFILLFIPILKFLINATTTLEIVSGIMAELILLLILLIVCYKKGEKPGWRWGCSKNQ